MDQCPRFNVKYQNAPERHGLYEVFASQWQPSIWGWGSMARGQVRHGGSCPRLEDDRESDGHVDAADTADPILLEAFGKMMSGRVGVVFSRIA